MNLIKIKRRHSQQNVRIGDELTFEQKAKQLLESLVELLRRHKKTVLLIAVVATATLLLSAITVIWLYSIDDLHFPSVGTIRTSGLKAYWDTNLTNETREIPWGQLYPGKLSNITLYARSISNLPITLEMTTANWTFRDSHDEIVFGPANSTEYMTLTWDYNGSTLNPGQVVQTVFTLHAKDTVDFVEYVIEKDVQQFSFDINVRTIEENAR